MPERTIGCIEPLSFVITASINILKCKTQNTYFTFKWPSGTIMMEILSKMPKVRDLFYGRGPNAMLGGGGEGNVKRIWQRSFPHLSGVFFFYSSWTDTNLDGTWWKEVNDMKTSITNFSVSQSEVKGRENC